MREMAGNSPCHLSRQGTYIFNNNIGKIFKFIIIMNIIYFKQGCGFWERKWGKYNT